MKKHFVIIAAIMGSLGVIFGAFGVHGLKSILTPELMETFRTGVFYHLIHSVVLFAISLNTNYDLKIPFYLIFAGIILFSFSLYSYTLLEIKILVFITPLGGFSLIVGWLSIILKVVTKKEII